MGKLNPYPNLSDEYVANFRLFRADPLRARYWYCRNCWMREEDHWTEARYCQFSPHRFDLADVEEDLARRNRLWNAEELGLR